MRDIKYIVIHCTGTTPYASVESIEKYWKEKRGWKNPGYHHIIKPCGTTCEIVPHCDCARDAEVIDLLDESDISNGVRGYNQNSIHIAYIGGVKKDKKTGKKVAVDTRTKAQEETMFNLIIELHEKFPKAEILGHKDFPNVRKSCPSFDVKTWLANYEPDLDAFDDRKNPF